MTLKTFIFIALLYVLGGAQLFTPATNFDIERILDVPWYELVFFDRFEDGSSVGCSSYHFSRSSDSNKIHYEYTYSDYKGDLQMRIHSLTPTSTSGVFDVIDNPSRAQQLNILAYADDYSWVVLGDTGFDGYPWVNVIVRSLTFNNTAGMSRVEEEAEKYGLSGRHDNTQGDSCPYEENLDKLVAEIEKEEKNAQFFNVTGFDVKKILGGTWYELFWYANQPVSSIDACSTFQFTQALNSDRIFSVYSFNQPITRIPPSVFNHSLAPTGISQVFDVIDNPSERRFNILDYAEDFSWLVIGDTGADGSPSLDILVRDLNKDNTAGISKAEEEAAKYGLGTRHDVTQGDACPYNGNKVQFFEEEQDEPATDFDVERILGDPWYEIVWFNNFEDNSSVACSVFEFSRSLDDSNKIYYDYTNNWPGIRGGNASFSFLLAPTGVNDVFDVIDPEATENPIPRKFNILDYAEDYSWVVIGDTGLDDIPWVSVIARSVGNDNSAGVDKAVEEAAKYGLEGRHDVIQSDSCPYDENRAGLLENFPRNTS